MKKKILFFALLSSVGLSVYPAKVLIRNRTDKVVFARINNQKRQHVLWRDQKTAMVAAGSLGAVTVGTSLLITEPIGAIRRRVAGYPNFVRIDRGSEKILGTKLVQAVFGWDIGEEKTLWGAPITKITFARVKGRKTITGTVRELQEQVKDLAHKYGGIVLENLPDKIVLFDELSSLPGRTSLLIVRREWDKKFDKPEKYQTYSVEIPELEEFTHTLKHPIRKKGTVELKSWGDVTVSYR